MLQSACVRERLYYPRFFRKSRKTYRIAQGRASPPVRNMLRHWHRTGKSSKKPFFIYDAVCIDKYCIMPDHIHLLVTLQSADLICRGRQGCLSLRDVVRQRKTYATGRCREAAGDKKLLLWQPRFYAHIIRNNEDYCEKRQYIEENPVKYLYAYQSARLQKHGRTRMSVPTRNSVHRKFVVIGGEAQPFSANINFRFKNGKDEYKENQ